MTQVDQPCILQWQLFLWGKKFHPNDKPRETDNSCLTILKACFLFSIVISHLCAFCLPAATKKLSLSAIGAVLMKGVLQVEKCQWQKSWWQTSQKLKVPASNSVVAFVCFKDISIFIVTYLLFFIKRYSLPWHLQVLISLYLCFFIFTVTSWNSCLGNRGLV